MEKNFRKKMFRKKMFGEKIVVSNSTTGERGRRPRLSSRFSGGTSTPPHDVCRVACGANKEEKDPDYVSSGVKSFISLETPPAPRISHSRAHTNDVQGGAVHAVRGASALQRQS